MKTVLLTLSLICATVSYAQNTAWIATVETGTGLRSSATLSDALVYGVTLERKLVSWGTPLALYGGVGARRHTLGISDGEREFAARSTTINAVVAIRYQVGKLSFNCRLLPAYRVNGQVIWTVPAPPDRFSDINFRGSYNSKFDLDLGGSVEYLVTKRFALGLNLMFTPVRRGITLSEQRYICPFAPPCYVWEDSSVSEVRTAVSTLSAQVAYRF